jgi:mannosylglycerate hydrolase
VLRSTGRISRNVHPYREEPAGPQVPTPQAQMIGTTTVALAVAPHAGGWAEADLVSAGERYRHPLHVTRGTALPGGELVTSGDGLSVDGATFTSLRRRDGVLEARVVAHSDSASTATVRGAFTSARTVDLLGRPGAELAVADGAVTLALRPWEIVTVRFDG